MTNSIDSGHTFLVDLTRHKGETEFLINSVKHYVKTKFPTAQLTWLARVDQGPLIHGAGLVVDENDLDSTALAARVKDLILQMSRTGAAINVFHVLSYDRWVLAAAASLNAASLTVVPTHMEVIKEERPGPQYAAPRPILPSEGGRSFSIEEAEQLAKQILHDGGHTSYDSALHLAKLRPLMVERDERARKNPLDRRSDQLITDLVSRGIRSGWLKYYRINEKTGFEHVWLYDIENQSSVVPIGNVANSQRLSDGIAITPSNTSALEVPNASLPQPPRRTEMMETKLRKRGIGSPSIARGHLFAAVEELVSNEQEAIPTAELIGKARERAMQTFKAAGHSKDYNWMAVADCFGRMMLAAGALLRSDDTPIFEGIGAYSAQAAKLAPNFRDVCEALLLEVIIKGLNDVNCSELYQLGLTLFQQGKGHEVSRESIVVRTDFLLTMLQSEGRIRMEEDGRLVACSNGRGLLRLTAV